MAIIDFFDRGWRLNPQGIAYASESEGWTFDETRILSCQIAHALLDTGLARDAKAAVLSPNDPRAWFCVLGVWRAGLAWVPLNPADPIAVTRQLVDAFDCEVLFFHSALTAAVEEMRPGLSKIKHYVCIDAENATDDAASLQTWVSGMPTVPPVVDCRMDGVVAVAPTGGTTGVPKGVMNTHRSLATCTAHLMLALFYPANEPIINLAAAPMTHASGIVSLAATAQGGTVVTLARPQPSAILDAIERHRVTELFLPPTMVYRLLAIPSIERRDFSSLRYLLYGAAPMSTTKLGRAIEVFGPVMTGVYGQMEAPCAISFLRPEEHFVEGALAPESRLASCGRPYPLITVDIRDLTNQPVPAGQPGEICVRGDLVMKGYYKSPDKTAETIIDGWLHTGDIGHLDDEGYLHITDRKKDLIISGGLNIYPSEIEQVIWRHPAVQDCVVIGVPHSDWGEAVKAVVELNTGAHVSEDELIQLCKQHLGGVHAPKSVDFVQSLPRSPNGKVLKKDVREPYWVGQERRV